MTAFSRKQDRLDAIKLEIYRNKTMARNGNNDDFKLAHPDWVRDAQGDSPKYTVLETKTKELVKRKQDSVLARREKMKNG